MAEPDPMSCVKRGGCEGVSCDGCLECWVQQQEALQVSVGGKDESESSQVENQGMNLVCGNRKWNDGISSSGLPAYIGQSLL